MLAAFTLSDPSQPAGYCDTKDCNLVASSSSVRHDQAQMHLQNAIRRMRGGREKRLTRLSSDACTWLKFPIYSPPQSQLSCPAVSIALKSLANTAPTHLRNLLNLSSTPSTAD